MVVFHDVTADRRHRDELASFAGVVAHDLLNPLTTIEDWSESLLDDEPGNDGVARIQRAATRMRSLINGLPAYTTARDASLAPATVDLNFHRAQADAGYAGTGLGLAICKRIVERHGGTITAAAGDRGGSRMTFTLPLA